MRKLFLMTGIVVAFLTAAEAQPRDLISDAATALKVGIAILEAYYSEKLVRDWEPFKAVIIMIIGRSARIGIAHSG